MRETIEKIIIVIVIIAMVAVAKLYFNQRISQAMEEKSRIKSLEVTASKSDSLENIVDVYNIENPNIDIEMDANSRELFTYLNKNLSVDSLEKVVMVGIPTGNNKLHWHIQIKNQ